MAVDISSHTGTKAQLLSLHAAGERRNDLCATSFQNSHRLISAGETASTDGVIGVTEGRDSYTETISRGELSRRTLNPGACSVIQRISPYAGETEPDRRAEIGAFISNSDTSELQLIGSFGTVENDGSTVPISFHLVELSQTGETASVAGVEGVAGRRDIEAAAVQPPLPDPALHYHLHAAAVD